MYTKNVPKSEYEKPIRKKINTKNFHLVRKCYVSLTKKIRAKNSHATSEAPRPNPVYEKKRLREKNEYEKLEYEKLEYEKTP